MKGKAVWVFVSCVVALSLVLASCATGPAAPATPTTPATPAAPATPTTPATPAKPAAPAPTGPEMVKLSLKKLDGTLVEKMVEKPRYGGTYVEIRTVDVTYFDEVRLYIHASQSQQLTNEALFRGDWIRGPTGTGEATWYYHLFPPMNLSAGVVAESWELADERTLVLRIRKGIRFQNKPPTNGRELVAEDVRYSLDRIWNIKSSYNYAAYPYATYFESMEATDKYTVVIKAKDKAKLSGIFDMVMMHHRIVPKDAVEFYKTLDDWKNAIGSGPFLLVDYVAQSSLLFKRNPEYWQKDPLFPENRLPYVDNVKWLIIADTATQMTALRTAKADRLAVTWEMANELKRTNPELKYVGYPAGSSAGIWFRLDKPEVPVYDKRVRHALNLAIDNQAIKDNYYGGYGDVLSAPVAPIGEDKNMYVPLEELPASTRELFGYNPEKAKQLLKEAGYPNGFKTQLLVTSISSTLDLATVVASMWAKVGVEVELTPREVAVYQSMLTNKQYDQMVFAGYSSPNPYRFFYEQPGSYINYSGLNDKYINELFQKVADSRFDEAKRQAGVRESVPYRLDLAYYLQLPMPYSFTLWQPWVKGYNGEFSVGYAHHYDYVMNVWVDTDLKFKMTGRK